MNEISFLMVMDKLFTTHICSMTTTACVLLLVVHISVTLWQLCDWPDFGEGRIGKKLSIYHQIYVQN